MATDNLNLSEKDINVIKECILNCANSVMQDYQEERYSAFNNAMYELAHELRIILKSEYCSIGIVRDGIAQDTVTEYVISENKEMADVQSYEFDSVRSSSADDGETLVSIALNSHDDISFFDKNFFNTSKHYDNYKSIIASGDIINSIVIPIRNNENKNYGFIQFINTQKHIDYKTDFLQFNDSLLGLVKIAHLYLNQKIVEEEKNFLDANFYNTMQDKKDNVNDLLDSIMKYFSEQFNAPIVSFRIPILNHVINTDRQEPLFYLRKLYIDPSIGLSKRKELEKQYFTDRLVKYKTEMSLVNTLRCDNPGKILESKSSVDFTQYGLELDEKTLIMPIFRDFDNKCIHPERNKFVFCNSNEHCDCIHRFKRLYGVFRLRFLKSDSYSNSNLSSVNSENNITKDRLKYLSKQISVLINSIVNRFENISLQKFHNEIKNSSFIKIRDFDYRCVEIIRNSINAKVCSIYRYDNLRKSLILSATTAKTFCYDADYYDTAAIKDRCIINVSSTNNILASVFYDKPNRSMCVYDITDTAFHESHFLENFDSHNRNENKSAMIVPIIKKDGTCSGVVLLLGKEKHNHSISTVYWEHDINNTEFIVNMLTRISESDTERLTFLSQLSHELLSPVTELVSDNDFTVNIAERNIDSFSKQQLISKIRENIDRNLLFKYIINDTQFIYSSSGKSIDYNIVKHDQPQTILLDAIRLLEKQAHEAKGLTIKTHISEMPSLYFDKEHMMQVFLNLIKNAIRYADKHTEICISYTMRDDGFHEISFADSGIRIQEEEKESIFELFYRGKEAKKKFVRGTGMGLYIVRDIMRAHGGDCCVRRLENPTEFVITLPNIKE